MNNPSALCLVPSSQGAGVKLAQVTTRQLADWREYLKRLEVGRVRERLGKPRPREHSGSNPRADELVSMFQGVTEESCCSNSSWKSSESWVWNSMS